MLDFLRNLISSDQARQRGSDFNQKKTNPINEIQILEAHQDIVRILLKVSEIRLIDFRMLFF